MTKYSSNPRRRRVIQLIGAAAVVVPFANAALTGTAEAVDVVKESDPAAVALKYKADATKAADRKDPKAFCDNCAYYSGKRGSTSAPCAKLAQKLVVAKGWCTAWESY
jgi:hypothetical protein